MIVGIFFNFQQKSLLSWSLKLFCINLKNAQSIFYHIYWVTLLLYHAAVDFAPFPPATDSQIFCLYISSNESRCTGAKWQCRDTVIHKIIISCELKALDLNIEEWSNERKKKREMHERIFRIVVCIRHLCFPIRRKIFSTITGNETRIPVNGNYLF